MHLLRVDRPGDILQAPLKVGLDRPNHAREVAKLPHAEFDGRQRRSVRGLVPREWHCIRARLTLPAPHTCRAAPHLHPFSRPPAGVNGCRAVATQGFREGILWVNF